MSKKEQNKINQLTSNGLINLDDENSLAQFDLLEGKFTLDPNETVIVDESKQPVYVSVTSRDEEGNETINTVWSEKANYVENLGEGLEITKEHLRDSKGNPVTNEHTYGVRLKVADEGELGGIKLPVNGGHLDINENGELDFDIDKIIEDDDLRATNDKFGFVKVGDHLKFDENGAITYDPYELPIASDQRVGGVKVGNGLKMTTDIHDGHKSILNVNSTAYRVHPFAQENDDNTREENFSKHPEVEQLSYIVDKILDYVQELSAKYENCYNQLNTLMDYDVTVHGGILSSNGRFNGREGAQINFNDDIQQLFRHNGVTDYTVVLTQSSSILGDLGDYVVIKNKDKRSGFTVSCTGARNDIDEFTWLVIPDNIRYSDERDPDDPSKFYYQVEAFKKTYTDNNGLIKPMCIFDEGRGLPIHHGHSSFAPNREVPVSLPGGKDFFNGSTDYVVIITPTLQNGTRVEEVIDPNGAVVGEYCVSRKEADCFYVKCTGSLYYKDKNGEEVLSNVGFDWVAIPFGTGNQKESSELVYDPAILPIRAGEITSNISEDIDGDGRLGDLHVNFGQTVFENRRYSILCQLMSDTGGQVGEYCGNFKDKLRDSFYIKYTGEVTYEDDIALKQFNMGWITIDKPTVDRVFIYKDEDNFYSVIIQFLDIDTGEAIYDEYVEQFEKGESYDFIYMVTDVKILGYEFVENEGALIAEKGSIFRDKVIKLKYKHVENVAVLAADDNKALVSNENKLIRIDPTIEE